MRHFKPEDIPNLKIAFPTKVKLLVRHAMVPGSDRAICGIKAKDWTLEPEEFEPMSIGCLRCRAMYNQITLNCRTVFVPSDEELRKRLDERPIPTFGGN